MNNVVIDTYSALAKEYGDERNLASCWGQAAAHAARQLRFRPTDKLIVDVGCGVGDHLAELSRHAPDAEFIGIEPANGMRDRALETTRDCANVKIVDGRFEGLPVNDHSVDYLFSIFAFHWVTDVEKSVGEIARVMKPTAAMDLTFIGRNNGREFIKATTPIFLKYLGAKGLLEAAAMRKQLTMAEARDSFARHFETNRLSVSETFNTYYDTLEGHWGWWVRIEGQFVEIPPDKKTECDDLVREALAGLETDRGIPYTLHELHVRLT